MKTGKLVLVTGASRGIGRSISLRLAREGYRVVAVARDIQALEALQADARDVVRGSLVGIPLDVRKSTDVQAFVDEIERAHGAVDILVNNAGVGQHGAFEEQTDRDYDETFDVNVRGFVNLARALVPSMTQRGGGWIVALVSTAGFRGFAGSSLYCGSKFALLGIIDSLQEELRTKGIRLTALCPGWVNTGLALASGLPEDYRSVVLQPDDVAAAVSYVLAQPSHVVVERLVLRPLIELPYSPIMGLDELPSVARTRD